MKRAILTIVALGVAIAALEGALRLVGYTPFSSDNNLAVASWAQFDPELGWISRPGARDVAGAGTFLDDGSRATRFDRGADGRPAVVVIGCSYTEGSGVDDYETFAWKLQDRFAGYAFTNLATGGYGTYQSLLRWRRYLREGRPIPRLVIFGFGDFHGQRDRATAAWMHGLRPQGKVRAFVPPHVDMVGGRLTEFPGRFVLPSRLARRSALWNVVEDRLVARADYAPDDAVTQKVHRAVLMQLRDEVERAGSRLLVANLWTGVADRDNWDGWFQSQKFSAVSCITPTMPFAHPDAFWHLHHADCIEREIRSAGLLAD